MTSYLWPEKYARHHLSKPIISSYSAMMGYLALMFAKYLWNSYHWYTHADKYNTLEVICYVGIFSFNVCEVFVTGSSASRSSEHICPWSEDQGSTLHTLLKLRHVRLAPKHSRSASNSLRQPLNGHYRTNVADTAQKDVRIQTIIRMDPNTA